MSVRWFIATVGGLAAVVGVVFLVGVPVTLTDSIGKGRPVHGVADGEGSQVDPNNED